LTGPFSILALILDCLPITLGATGRKGYGFMPDIRIMDAADIDFAVSLTDREGWGNVADDFERLMALEPNGCFIARERGERVGMISTTTYGDHAFIGSLIVLPDRRGRGIGEALMRRALKHLQSGDIACIELDATFLAAPLYRRIGFKDTHPSLRFFRPAEENSTVDSPPALVADVDRLIGTVTDIDKRLTGLDRSRVLARLVTEFSGSVFIGTSPAPVGYAIAYPRSGNRINIGPLVAADDSTAEYILDTIIGSFASLDIGVGVPEIQSSASGILRKRGFLYQPPSLRMYLGQRRHYEDHVYAIVSAEKG
jgi:GNAT superfamily N-acetyltransferase